MSKHSNHNDSQSGSDSFDWENAPMNPDPEGDLGYRGTVLMHFFTVKGRLVMRGRTPASNGMFLKADRDSFVNLKDCS